VSQEGGFRSGRQSPPPDGPQAAGELWKDGVDKPAGEVAPASESVEVLADLVTPSRPDLGREASLDGSAWADAEAGHPQGTRPRVRFIPGGTAVLLVALGRRVGWAFHLTTLHLGGRSSHRR